MTWDRIDIGSAIMINIHPPPSLKRHKRYKMPFLEDNMSSWGKSVSVLLLLVYVLELSLPRLVSKCTYPAHTYVRTPDHINRIPHFPPNAYVASSLSSSQHSQVSICHIQHVVLGLLRMWKSRKSVMNILFARLWESASAAGARTPTYETQSIVVDMFQCMFSRQPAVCRRGWIPSCFEENLNVYMFFNFSTLPSVVCVRVWEREKKKREWANWFTPGWIIFFHIHLLVHPICHLSLKLKRRCCFHSLPVYLPSSGAYYLVGWTTNSLFLRGRFANYGLMIELACDANQLACCFALGSSDFFAAAFPGIWILNKI